MLSESFGFQLIEQDQNLQQVLDQLIEKEQVLDDTTSSLLIDQFNYAMPPFFATGTLSVLNSGARTISSKAMGIVELVVSVSVSVTV